MQTSALETINNIKRNGFGKLSVPVLTAQEIREFESIIDRLAADKTISVDYSANSPTHASLVGRDPNLDRMIEKILSNPAVKEVLSEIVGDDFKIWEISARISQENDPGLGLHVDAVGQCNIAYIINDQKTPAGVTMFWPGSHLLSRFFIDRVGQAIEWAGTYFLKRMLAPLTAEAGQIAFFVNKTYHGRLPATSGQRKIILMGCFPVGSRFKPMPQAVDADSIQYPELRKRLSLSQGAHPISGGFVRIGPEGAKSTAYTMSLEPEASASFKRFGMAFKARLANLCFGVYKLLRPNRSNISHA